mgnify:FL=1
MQPITLCREVNPKSKVKWNVKGLLPKNEIVLLCGNVGFLNTLIATDLAFSAAAGISWCKRSIVDKQRIYSALDGCMYKESGYFYDVWMKNHGFDPALNKHSFPYHYQCESINFSDHYSLCLLGDDLGSCFMQKPSIIVLNTSDSEFGRIKTRQQAVSLIRYCDYLRGETHATILLVDKDGGLEHTAGFKTLLEESSVVYRAEKAEKNHVPVLVTLKNHTKGLTKPILLGSQLKKSWEGLI